LEPREMAFGKRSANAPGVTPRDSPSRGSTGWRSEVGSFAWPQALPRPSVASESGDSPDHLQAQRRCLPGSRRGIGEQPRLPAVAPVSQRALARLSDYSPGLLDCLARCRRFRAALLHRGEQ